MSDVLLRYYDGGVMEDGYPYEWHRSTTLRQYPTMKTITLPAIKDYIRELAGHRCLRCGHPYRKGEVGPRGEWSPCDEECRHPGPYQWDELVMPRGGLPHGEVPEPQRYAQWRILTVHHLDEDKRNCRWWNLAALCQRCHLRMQRAVVMGRPYHFEHSEWFKPFAAGFYAWKYLGEELGREETLTRLPQLLALEHRFTQEALL